MGKRKKPAKSSQPSSIKSQAMTEANALKLTRCHTDEYDSQLQQKVDAVKALLPQAKEAAWEVHASPKTAFRLRCNFQVWHEAEGEKLYYVMYDGDNERRTPLRVVDFPRGCAETQRLMPLVLDALRGDDVLRDKCHEVRFHTTLRGSSVVVLVYNRPIDKDKNWKTKAEKLAKQLQVVLVGRSSKFRITLNGDAPRVREKLKIAGKDVNLYQLEGEFSQPNGSVCEKMVTWAVERTQDAKNDLLELYCGNGNFTIPMSRNFRKVLATEVSKANTECARENLTANSVKNVQFARLNAKETADALQPDARPFKRLTEAGVDLSSLKLETLFVDPPRAGLEPAAIGLARSFETVVYVSCNPETLADDIEQLSHTHDVTHAAVFDQFPYTRHCEAGVLLKKRSGVDLSTVPEPRAREKKKSKRYAGKRKGKGKGGGKEKKARGEEASASGGDSGCAVS
jgi:tRNA (uracil-5-)-methyltransferase